MAWTVPVIDKINVSNKRLHVLSCTADAAESAVDTGLDIVDYFHYSPVSLTTGALTAFKNLGSTSTALNGYVGFSGVTSGDVFFLYAYGR